MLPFRVWESWATGLTAPRVTGGDAELDAALARDRAILRARLAALIEQPGIREALYIASPGLHDDIPVWSARPDSSRGRKIERALTRYLGRMCYRCTPFGLFAGTSIGRFADESQLQLPGLDGCRRHLRIDNDYLFELLSDLQRDDRVRRRVRYVPNSTAYVLGGEIRYIQRHVQGVRRFDELVSAEASEIVLELLRQARAGAGRSQLAQVIREQVADVSLEEATGFVTALIDDQLLVPELGPTLTGAEPVEALLETAGRLHLDAPVLDSLAAARTALQTVSERPIGAPPTAYRAVSETLGAGSRPGGFALPVQVDLYKPAPGLALPRPVARALTTGVDLLHRLAIPEPGLLRGFALAFRARFGARSVPLVEALDSEAGIGLSRPRPPGRDTPVLGDIGFPARASGSAPEPRLADALARRQRHLAALVERARREHLEELRLNRADIAQLVVGPAAPLPDSFAVLASVSARSPEALQRGRFRASIVHAFGASGSNHLGRFCHGDADLHERVRALITAEEAHQPDAIFAEIVHLPDGRMGNVLLRPRLREYEIPYLGISGAPRDRQIALSDVLVQVSIDGVITLHSRRLRRRVIPRMSTAHAYSKSNLPAYRFLCYLQHEQTTRYVAFTWGSLEEQDGYLPRVVHGQLVLSPRRWRLAGTPLTRLGRARGAALYRAAQQLRERLAWPRHVGIQAGDHVIPIDLDNILSIEGLAHSARTRDQLRVIELCHGDLVMAGPDGAYTHELLVPFVREPVETARASERAAAIDSGSGASPSARVDTAATASARVYLPGSERLLVHLFTGPTTADSVLCETLFPLLERARADTMLERWSFTRFDTPSPHLRLLLHGRADALYGRFVPELHRVARALEDRRSLARMTFETYDPALLFSTDDPELTAALEVISAVDSRAVLAMLTRLPGIPGLVPRFHVALWWTARALQALVASTPNRLALARTRYQRLAEALHLAGHVEVTRGLGDKYRRERANVEHLMAATASDAAVDPLGLAKLVRAASAAFADVIAGFGPLRQHLVERSPATRDTALEILCDHHSARILRSRHREQRLVLWYLLTRAYESAVARGLTG